MRHGLPRPAGAVRAAKFSRQLVEVFPRAVVALLHRDLQRRAVVLGLGDLAPRGLQDRVEVGHRLAADQRVVDVFPRAPVAHEARLPELREMIGNARLAHAEDFLQLDDRKFLFAEQQQHPQPRGVGEQRETFDERRHAAIPRRDRAQTSCARTSPLPLTAGAAMKPSSNFPPPSFLNSGAAASTVTVPFSLKK